MYTSKLAVPARVGRPRTSLPGMKPLGVSRSTRQSTRSGNVALSVAIQANLRFGAWRSEAAGLYSRASETSY